MIPAPNRQQALEIDGFPMERRFVQRQEYHYFRRSCCLQTQHIISGLTHLYMAGLSMVALKTNIPSLLLGRLTWIAPMLATTELLFSRDSDWTHPLKIASKLMQVIHPTLLALASIYGKVDKDDAGLALGYLSLASTGFLLAHDFDVRFHERNEVHQGELYFFPGFSRRHPLVENR